MSWSADEARAHGKVILAGEHAVVHGCPAIAAALPEALRLRVRADAPTGTLRIPAWGLEVPWGPESVPTAVARVREAIRAVLLAAGIPGDSLGRLPGVVGESRLSAGAGLGSSAALCVALARLALGPDVSPKVVLAAAMAGETVFHGDASGLDPTVAAYGGVIEFRRGADPTSLAGPRTIPIVVACTGDARSTATEVAKVAARLRDDRDGTLACFAAIEAATTAVRGAIERGDLEAIGRGLDDAHASLSRLGVSTRRLDALCATARDHGALGAKLTGAGGGGSIIAVIEEPRALVERFERDGVDTFATVLRPNPLTTPDRGASEARDSAGAGDSEDSGAAA